MTAAAHQNFVTPTVCCYKLNTDTSKEPIHILNAGWELTWYQSTDACTQRGREEQEEAKEPHRKEEEELMQLALDKVVGQVAHCIGPQRSNVGELARLLPPQGSYPFSHIISHLRHPCQNCNTWR